MANAKKCDRCGEFYLDNEAEHNSRVTKGVAFIGVHNDFRWGYKDLCDDCQDKLDQFLDGRELKEEASNE